MFITDLTIQMDRFSSSHFLTLIISCHSYENCGHSIATKDVSPDSWNGVGLGACVQLDFP